MTKKDIVNEVAEEARQPKTRIAAALDIFLAEVTGAMVRQERVEIRRFGTFEVTHRKSRIASNFSADEEITLPARAVPRFVPFKAFKDLVERARPLQDETTVPPPKRPKPPLRHQRLKRLTAQCRRIRWNRFEMQSPAMIRTPMPG